MKVLVLNGFDRCGSSMVAGLLAHHPRIACFYQPFSRTEVHASQYEVWPIERESAPTRAFLAAFLDGRVDEAYLAAPYFREHSSALAPAADKLNVVKETKLHFQLPWLRAAFPGIDVMGLWRDPRGIVASLVRNGFHESWYGLRAFEAIRPTILATPALEPLVPLVERGSNSIDRMSLVVAARTLFMAAHLEPADWIVYERVLADADAELGRVAARHGLEPYAFSRHVARDYNVSGAPFRRADLWRELFDAGQCDRLDEIFESLSEPSDLIQSASCARREVVSPK